MDAAAAGMNLIMSSIRTVDRLDLVDQFVACVEMLDLCKRSFMIYQLMIRAEGAVVLLQG